jgi:S-adenosylmethionine hydrolase
VPRFPAGTLHLVVVDPGVGSSRRAIIAEVGGCTLIGPDNSVLGYLFDGSEKVYEIDVSTLGERSIASTFHGRDIFAPAAARLAAGTPPSALGNAVEAYEHLVFPMVEFKGASLFGKVIHIDRFGNLVTNIADSQLRAFLSGADPAALRVHVAERAVDGLCDHYAERAVGELLNVVGSSGLLEVAAREASAAVKLGAEVGAPVRIGCDVP